MNNNDEEERTKVGWYYSRVPPRARARCAGAQVTKSQDSINVQLTKQYKYRRASEAVLGCLGLALDTWTATGFAWVLLYWIGFDLCFKG